MDLKELYSIKIIQSYDNTLYLNKRLLVHIIIIITKVLNRNITGINIDLVGSGDRGFTDYLYKIGIGLSLMIIHLLILRKRYI